MNNKKIYLITDLGGGDGGKGGIVHAISSAQRAHTILKIGGAQGSHGVRTSRSEHFNFSQFGCGTFEGVKTHITNLMVVEPLRLMHEAELLQTGWRIQNIFDYLTVDEESLCVTPFHTIASRLRELARKDKPKGTIGVGVGEAARDAELYPELAIHVKDLQRSDLKDRLEAVRLQKIRELGDMLQDSACFWTADLSLAQKEIDLLLDPGYTQWSAQQFKEIAAKISIVGTSYLEEKILSQDGIIVAESSHGILTDKYYGFHPNTSRLRTIPSRLIELLGQRGYTGEIIKLGLTRVYQIRHGAGPMVTESSDLLPTLLPGSNKDENRWQGRVRVGALDLVMLRYAIEACGGPSFFHGLAISWSDQIPVWGRWEVCDSYQNAVGQVYFSSPGNIRVRHGADEAQLVHQEKLGQLLDRCRPNLTSYPLLEPSSFRSLVDLCGGVLEERLRVPVKMVSFGPTEEEKIYL